MQCWKSTEMAGGPGVGSTVLLNARKSPRGTTGHLTTGLRVCAEHSASHDWCEQELPSNVRKHLRDRLPSSRSASRPQRTIGAIAHRICQLIWMILYKGVRTIQASPHCRNDPHTPQAWLASRTSSASDMSSGYSTLITSPMLRQIRDVKENRTKSA